jgi:hypothetical protein
VITVLVLQPHRQRSHGAHHDRCAIATPGTKTTAAQENVMTEA